MSRVTVELLSKLWRGRIQTQCLPEFNYLYTEAAAERVKSLYYIEFELLANMHVCTLVGSGAVWFLSYSGL